MRGLGRLGASALRSLSSRRLVQAAGGTAVGICAAGTAQGLYLWGQYHPLPEARGPLQGVAQFLRETRNRVGGQRSSAERRDAAHAAATPGGSLTRTLSGAARSPRDTVADGDGRQQQQQQQQQQRRMNILFVGDSLVTGVGCGQEGEPKGPPLPRVISEFLARALRVDIQWTAIGHTGADVAGLSARSLPVVAEEARRVQQVGQRIDMVVVVCGLNDLKRAYTSLRRTASGFRSELSSFVEAIHKETGTETSVVLPALPVHRAPVFHGWWPLQPLFNTLAAVWDDQKEALAKTSLARSSSSTSSALRAACGQTLGRISFVRNATNGDEAWGAEDFWAADGIHPNDRGYQVWGEYLAASILAQALLSVDRR
jgi:lysophospholipase L1-like esterase